MKVKPLSRDQHKILKIKEKHLCISYSILWKFDCVIKNSYSSCIVGISRSFLWKNDQDVSHYLTRFVHTASNGDETNDYLNNFNQIFKNRKGLLYLFVISNGNKVLTTPTMALLGCFLQVSNGNKIALTQRWWHY